MSYFYINPKEFFTLNSKGYAHLETLRSSTRFIQPCRTLVEEAQQFNNNNNGNQNATGDLNNNNDHFPQRKRNFFNSDVSVLVDNVTNGGDANIHNNNTTPFFIPTRGNLIPSLYRSLHSDTSFREFERAKKECQDAVNDIAKLVIERRRKLLRKQQQQQQRKQQNNNNTQNGESSNVQLLLNVGGGAKTKNQQNSINTNYLEAKFVDGEFFVGDEQNVRGFFDENVDCENEDDSADDSDELENDEDVDDDDDEDLDADDGENFNGQENFEDEIGGNNNKNKNGGDDNTNNNDINCGFNLSPRRGKHRHAIIKGRHKYDNTGMNLDDVLAKYNINNNDHNSYCSNNYNDDNNASKSNYPSLALQKAQERRRQLLLGHTFSSATQNMDNLFDSNATSNYSKNNIITPQATLQMSRNVLLDQARKLKELQQQQHQETTRAETTKIVDEHQQNNNNNQELGKRAFIRKQLQSLRNSKRRKNNNATENQTRDKNGNRHYHPTSRKIILPENVARLSEVYPNSPLFTSYNHNNNNENENGNNYSFNNNNNNNNIREASVWTTSGHCKNAHFCSAVHSLILANKLKYPTLNQSDIAYGNFTQSAGNILGGDLLKGTDFEFDYLDYKKAGAALAGAKHNNKSSNLPGNGEHYEAPMTAFSPASSTWAFAAFEVRQKILPSSQQHHQSSDNNNNNNFNIENNFVLPQISLILQQEGEENNKNNTNNDNHTNNGNDGEEEENPRMYENLGVVGVVLYANQQWTWVIVDDLIPTDRGMTTPWFLRPSPQHPQSVVAVDASIATFSDHFYRLISHRFEQSAYVRSHIKAPNESWPLIFEKALGKLFGSYSVALSAGTAREILETVTGPFGGEVFLANRFFSPNNATCPAPASSSGSSSGTMNSNNEETIDTSGCGTFSSTESILINNLIVPMNTGSSNFGNMHINNTSSTQKSSSSGLSVASYFASAASSSSNNSRFGAANLRARQENAHDDEGDGGDGISSFAAKNANAFLCSMLKFLANKNNLSGVDQDTRISLQELETRISKTIAAPKTKITCDFAFQEDLFALFSVLKKSWLQIHATQRHREDGDGVGDEKFFSSFLAAKRMHSQNQHLASSLITSSCIMLFFPKILFRFSASIPNELGGDDVSYLSHLEQFNIEMSKQSALHLYSKNFNNRGMISRGSYAAGKLRSSGNNGMRGTSNNSNTQFSSLSNHKTDLERNRKCLRYPSASLEFLLKAIYANNISRGGITSGAGGDVTQDFYFTSSVYQEHFLKMMKQEQLRMTTSKNSRNTNDHNNTRKNDGRENNNNNDSNIFSSSSCSSPLDSFNELASIFEKQLGRKIIATARVRGGKREFSQAKNKAHEVAYVFHTALNHKKYFSNSSNHNAGSNSKNETIDYEERLIRKRIEKIYKFIPFAELPVVGITRNATDETLNSIEVFDPYVDELELMEGRFQATQAAISEAEIAAGGSGYGSMSTSTFSMNQNNNTADFPTSSSFTNNNNNNSYFSNNNPNSSLVNLKKNIAGATNNNNNNNGRRKHQLSQGFAARCRSIPWLIACEMFESVSLSFLLDEPRFSPQTQSQLEEEEFLRREQQLHEEHLRRQQQERKQNQEKDENNENDGVRNMKANKAKIILEDEQVLWHVTTLREVAPPTVRGGRSGAGGVGAGSGGGNGAGDGDGSGSSDDSDNGNTNSRGGGGQTGKQSGAGLMTELDEMIRNHAMMPNSETAAGRRRHQKNSSGAGFGFAGIGSDASSSFKNTNNSASSSSSSSQRNLRQAPVIPFVLHYRSAADTALSICLEQEDLRVVQTATRLEQGSSHALNTQKDLQGQDDDDAFSPLRGRQGLVLNRPMSAQERSNRNDEMNSARAYSAKKTFQQRQNFRFQQASAYDAETKDAEVTYKNTNKNVFASHSPPLHFLRLMVLDFGKHNPDPIFAKIKKDQGVFGIQHVLDQFVFHSLNNNSTNNSSTASSQPQPPIIRSVRITEVQYAKSITIADFTATAESYYVVFPFVLKGPAASFCVRILSPSISDIAVWQLPVPSILTALMMNGLGTTFVHGRHSSTKTNSSMQNNSNSSYLEKEDDPLSRENILGNKRNILFHKRKSEQQLIREQKREDALKQQLARFTATATGRVLKSDCYSLMAMLDANTNNNNSNNNNNNQMLMIKQTDDDEIESGRPNEKISNAVLLFPATAKRFNDDTFLPLSRPFTRVAPARVGVHTSCLPRPVATATRDPNVEAARKLLRQLEEEQYLRENPPQQNQQQDLLRFEAFATHNNNNQFPFSNNNNHQNINNNNNKLLVVGAAHAESDDDAEDVNNSSHPDPFVRHNTMINNNNNNNNKFRDFSTSNATDTTNESSMVPRGTCNGNNNNNSHAKSTAKNPFELEVNQNLLSGLRKSFDLADLEGNGELREKHQIRRALQDFLLNHTPLGQMLSEKFGLVEPPSSNQKNVVANKKGTPPKSNHERRDDSSLSGSGGINFANLNQRHHSGSNPSSSTGTPSRRVSPRQKQQKTVFSEQEFIDGILECIK